MNTPLKNPCLECDHHLAGGDKNCDRCRDCERRVEYVNAIGKCPSSTVSEHVDLEGMGGPDFAKSKNEILAQEESLSIDPIENHIRDVCKKAGTTIERVRAGIKGSINTYVNQEVNNVRDEIIVGLASGKFGHLTQPQIGKYLNISGHLVCQRMKKMDISPRPRDKKAKSKPPMQANKIQSKSKNKTLTLCFDDHPELYNDIIKLADRELREPENQALYILLKVRERGLKIPEA